MSPLLLIDNNPRSSVGHRNVNDVRLYRLNGLIKLTLLLCRAGRS